MIKKKYMISPFKITCEKQKWFKPIFGHTDKCLCSTTSWIFSLVLFWSHWLGWTVFFMLQPLFSKSRKRLEWSRGKLSCVTGQCSKMSHEMRPLTIPCCGISPRWSSGWPCIFMSSGSEVWELASQLGFFQGERSSAPFWLPGCKDAKAEPKHLKWTSGFAVQDMTVA